MSGDASHPRLPITVTMPSRSGPFDIKVMGAVADSGAQVSIFPSKMLQGNTPITFAPSPSKTDIRGADGSSLSVTGVVDSTVSATNQSGEIISSKVRFYVVNNVSECYLSCDAMRGLKIVNEHFPEAGSGNRHNDKAWNRSGIVVERKGFGQYQVKLDGSGRLSLRTRAHLKPFQSYSQLGTAGTSAPPLLNPSYSLQTPQEEGEDRFQFAPTSPVRSRSPSLSLGSNSPPSELSPSSPEAMETQPGHRGDDAEAPHRHSATQDPTSASQTTRRRSPDGSPPSPGQYNQEIGRQQSQSPQGLPRRSSRSRTPVDKYIA